MPLRGVKEVLPLIIQGFRSHVEFDMREPKYYAAATAFALRHTVQISGKLYVGEAGGFQDLFAGFGIRMAMTAGYLAASSILGGSDYSRLWRRQRRAGAVRAGRNGLPAVVSL